MNTSRLAMTIAGFSLLVSAPRAAAQACNTMQYGWTQTWGSTGDDWGHSLAIGETGEIYLAGHFEKRVDFDPSPKRTDWHQSNGESDASYIFFDADGRHRWTGTVGGSSFDIPLGVALFEDRLYFAGYFRGPADMNPKRRVDLLQGNPERSNAYLTALGVDKRYHWTKSIYCEITSLLQSVVVDSQGNPVAVGSYSGAADFDPGKRKDIRRPNGPDGYNDVVVWKLNPKGRYQWTHTVGGADLDTALHVTLDRADNIYACGQYFGNVDFDPRGKGDVHVGLGLWDAFLTSLSPKGKVRWTWSVTSSSYDSAWGVATSQDQRIYVSGFVSGDADFDARGNGDLRKLQGAADCFLSVLSTEGEYLGTHILHGIAGQGSVIPRAVAVDDARGRLALTGGFAGTVDLDPGPGEDRRVSTGSWDIFIVLLTLDGRHIESFVVGGSDQQDWPEDVRFDRDGNLLVTGYFQASGVDFDPCIMADVRQRTGDTWPDAFLTKYLCDDCD